VSLAAFISDSTQQKRENGREAFELIVQGQVVAFYVLLALIAMTIYLIRKGGSIPAIRKIAGLEAIEEAIGRAAETGRPVFFTPGAGSVASASSAIDTMSAVEVLAHVSDLTAKYNLDLMVGTSQADTHTIADQTVREAYSRAGQSDAYKPEMVQFLSPQQFGFAGACAGYFERERPAAIFLLGWFAAETVTLAEAAALSGAIVIGGMVRYVQLPSLLVSCDYTLIAEELYVAGAYLSKQPVKMACIRAQDYGKLAAITLIAVGAVMATVGSKVLIDFLK
jgi:hypothetical protein